MAVPTLGYLTGDPVKDIITIAGFIDDLIAYLNQLDAAVSVESTGWSVSGVTPDTTLVSGGSPTETENVLGTLIQALLEKGVIDA